MHAVPFKYAQKEVKGIVYILSFGIGVAIVSPVLPPYFVMLQ